MGLLLLHVCVLARVAGWLQPSACHVADAQAEHGTNLCTVAPLTGLSIGTRPLTSAVLPMTSAVLPMTSAVLPMTSAVLPMTSAAPCLSSAAHDLTMTSPRALQDYARKAEHTELHHEMAALNKAKVQVQREFEAFKDLATQTARQNREETARLLEENAALHNR